MDDSPIASWLTRQLPDLAVACLIPGTEAQYALMLARDNDGLRHAVDDALARIRRDGRYAALYERWFGEGALAARQSNR